MWVKVPNFMYYYMYERANLYKLFKPIRDFQLIKSYIYEENKLVR